MERVTFLLTCHNRKDTTVAGMRSLARQELTDGQELHVILVDAGSTDGTVEAIGEQFPEVEIVRKDASHYWSGGMREAFTTAMAYDPDFYVWMNDDTQLYPFALQRLLETYREVSAHGGRAPVIVGSTKDPVTGHFTYGGLKRKRLALSLGFIPTEPGDKPRPCDTLHGNFVLISREVADSVGNISDDFTHGLGDYDYGLRAGEHGHPCWIAPGYIGECAGNPEANTWLDPDLPLSARRAQLRSPKGLPPEEWLLFVRRHGGPRYQLARIKLLLRLWFPGLWKLLRRVARGKWN